MPAGSDVSSARSDAQSQGDAIFDRSRDSSLYYCLFLEKGEPHAERYFFLDEPIVVIWYEAPDDPAVRVVREVFRFEEIEGQIARLRFYGFCPEAMGEIVDMLNLPLATFGYGVWSPEFLRIRKEEEFLRWRAEQHPHWDEQAKAIQS